MFLSSLLLCLCHRQMQSHRLLAVVLQLPVLITLEWITDKQQKFMAQSPGGHEGQAEVSFSQSPLLRRQWLLASHDRRINEALLGLSVKDP